MRRAYLIAILLFVFTAFIPLALGGTSLVQTALYADRVPAANCAAYPLDPFVLSAGPFDGSVVLHLTNEGDAATTRVCLFQGPSKRMDMTIDLAAGETRDIVVQAPPGVYTYRHEATYAMSGGGASTSGSGTFSTMWCLSHSGDVHMSFQIGPTAVGGSAWGGGCIPAPLVVGLFGLVASGGSFALGKFPGLGALLLYSRLARPRLLDQAVRTRVYELVAREPGIHSRQIVRGVDAADGQTAYHRVDAPRVARGAGAGAGGAHRAARGRSHSLAAAAPRAGGRVGGLARSGERMTPLWRSRRCALPVDEVKRGTIHAFDVVLPFRTAYIVRDQRKANAGG